MEPGKEMQGLEAVWERSGVIAPRTICIKCGYELGGLPVGKTDCPECGELIAESMAHVGAGVRVDAWSVAAAMWGWRLWWLWAAVVALVLFMKPGFGANAIFQLAAGCGLVVIAVLDGWPITRDGEPILPWAWAHVAVGPVLVGVMCACFFAWTGNGFLVAALTYCLYRWAFTSRGAWVLMPSLRENFWVLAITACPAWSLGLLVGSELRFWTGDSVKVALFLTPIWLLGWGWLNLSLYTALSNIRGTGWSEGTAEYR
jgi:hypothetical protein